MSVWSYRSERAIADRPQTERESGAERVRAHADDEVATRPREAPRARCQLASKAPREMCLKVVSSLDRRVRVCVRRVERERVQYTEYTTHARCKSAQQRFTCARLTKTCVGTHTKQRQRRTSPLGSYVYSYIRNVIMYASVCACFCVQSGYM